MRNPVAVVSSLGLIGGLFALCIFCLSIFLFFYGLVLAFSASIVLGIIALIIEPCPLIISLVYFAFGYNIPEHLVRIFSGH